MKWNYNESRGGIDFQEQELLEFSVCPIPAHPEALVESRAMDGAVAELEGWATKTLDTLKAARMLAGTGEGSAVTHPAAEGASAAPAESSVTTATNVIVTGSVTNASAATLTVPSNWAWAPLGLTTAEITKLIADAIKADRAPVPLDPIILELDESDEGIFELLETVPAMRTEDTLDIAPEDFYRACKEAVTEGLRETVTPCIRAELRQAMTALTGRLD